MINILPIICFSEKNKKYFEFKRDYLQIIKNREFTTSDIYLLII